MADELIHIVPEWPSYSQTFVRDDIEVSRAIFRKVSVFPLPIRERSSRAVHRDSFLVFVHIPKMIFLLRKKPFRESLIESWDKKFGFRGLALLIYKMATAGILISKFDLGNRQKKVIIHAHFLSTGLEVAILVKSLIPSLQIFATGHGSDVLFSSTKKLNYFLRNTDVFLAASMVVKNSLESQMDELCQFKPIILLRYCRIPGAVEIKQSAIKKFDSTLTRILTVARFHPQKGLALAIQAARNLRDHDVDFVWSVIGDGLLRSELQALVDEYDLNRNVKFLGVKSREFVMFELEKSDIFVLPSIRTSTASDGLPVAILEAMSLGTYVVTTDVGGISEAIGLDRGSLIEPDPDELSAELQRIIELGKSNFQYVLNAHKWVNENCSLNSEDPLHKIYLARKEID